MPRTDPARIELLERSLMRAAESLGDLVPIAMERFYAQHPEAIEAFEHHGLGKRKRLEADMVDTALYCLMSWLEREAEVSIMLYGSVPHHRNTLNVWPEWYRGLLNSVIDLIAGSIPVDAPDETRLIEEIRAGLLGAITEALDSMSVQKFVHLTA